MADYNGNYNAGNNNATARGNDHIVNTNGVMLTNEKFGKFLKTRFWGNCMGMDIGSYNANGPTPAYEAIRRADVFSHSISFATIFELKEACEEVLDSVTRTGKFESTAILAGQYKNSIIEISNGANINMAPGIYLVIYKEIDTSKRSNKFEFYPFSSTKILRNYNHTTGDATEDIRSVGNFKKFIKILNQAANAFTMAQAHAISEVGKKDRSRTFMVLAALAQKSGIDTTTEEFNGGSKPRSNGNTSYNRNGYNNNYNRNNNGGNYNRYNNGNNFRRTSNSTNFNNGQSNPQKFRPYQNPQANTPDDNVDIVLDASTLQSVDLSELNS